MPTVMPSDCRLRAADSAADLLLADLSTIVHAERPAGQSGNVPVAVGVGLGETDGVALGVAPGAIAPPVAGGVGVGVVPGGGWSPSFSGAPVVGKGVGVAPTAGVGVGVAVASVTRAGPPDSSAMARMAAAIASAITAAASTSGKRQPRGRATSVLAAAPQARHHSCSGPSVAPQRRQWRSGGAAVTGLGCGCSGGVC